MDETCGGCRFFKVSRERDDGRLGECRLSKVMGVFHEGMRACPSFSRFGAESIEPTHGHGGASRAPARVFSTPSSAPSRVSASTLAAVLGNLSGEQLRTVLSDALCLACMSQGAELGRAWSAGELLLAPREDDLKPKQVPLEAFFHKLVMIRDNLRVMEQKVNSHEHLQDGEKLDLQRQISLAYLAVARFAGGFLERGSGTGAAGEAAELLRTLRLEAERQSLFSRAPALGERWSGGEARFARESETITETIELFFHRLCVLRDRLMGLEGLLGAHPHVGPDEADAMCGYIRRCYGSLTSFNVLFRDREDYFTSNR
jgi:hypothetical protein